MKKIFLIIVFIPVTFFIKAQEITETFSTADIEKIFNIAEKYFYKGDLDKAEEIFEELLGIKPDNLLTLKHLAQISVANRNISRIKFYYERVLKLNPEDQDALVSLGVIYLNKGNIKSAEKLLLKAVINKPDDELALFNLSVLYSAKNEYIKAINTLESLISINSKNSEYYQTLGLYQLIQGNFPLAELNFLKALKLDSKLTEARKGLVIVYQNLNELDKSSELLNELEAISPDLQYLNILKAYQYYLQEEINSAIKYTRVEIENYPGEPDAYFFLNDLYMINGDSIKADSILIRANEISDGNYNLFFSLLKTKSINNNK